MRSSGKGLAVLDVVALRWGVERVAAGKTVWCELGDSFEGGGAAAARSGLVHATQ
ncbi:hypothetical protein ACGFZQ_25080 [Streptomyces sp. NPDC048254]|uniref:hypothetical protein n=1 Tax=Streptomyces sp. NPDC048254 TaxID=3365525 RepID=UPI0037119D19